MDTVKLIENIKKEKKLLKMTNAELSSKSGIALGTLNKILSFKTSSIKTETLNKIERALKGEVSTNSTLNKNDNFGFIKVATCSPEVKVADVFYNLSQIKNGIDDASDKGVKLLVFPELTLTGATCGDLFYQDALLNASLSALNEITKYSLNREMLIFIGMPIKNAGRIYDVAVAISKGEILGFIPKTELNYTDKRYFSSEVFVEEINVLDGVYPFGKDLLFKSLNSDNFTVAVEIGSEVFGSNPPSNNHAQNGAFIVVNLSCDNETVERAEFRRNVLKVNSSLNNLAYVYANAGFGESTTDLVYSGHSLILENGTILNESELFNNSIIVSDVDVDFLSYERSKKAYQNGVSRKNYQMVEFSTSLNNGALDRKFDKMPFVPSYDASRFELILKMQASALQKRINHVNAKTVVIGLSGGLDSTLALLVAVRAMKSENRDLKDILAITMPCFGTSKRTKNNATMLAEALGVTLKEINIKLAVSQHFKDIGHDENLTDTTYENSQARERTQVLMDVANKTGGLVVGTGDLSEMALGWATYNGDHMSMYSVNSAIPKTLIRYLVDYEANRSNKVLKDTLKDILDTPVSPELLPPKDGDIAQKTEDIVGPYLLHDFYIYYILRRGYSPKKVFYIAKTVFSSEFTSETLYKWLKNFYNRFFNQQFKRSCVPDGVKIGSVGFSPRGDLMMPSDACKTVWLKELDEIEV